VAETEDKSNASQRGSLNTIGHCLCRTFSRRRAVLG
jgi:hypothetical protein